MRNSWEGEVEWGMLIAARMALARQLGIFRNYRNPHRAVCALTETIPKIFKSTLYYQYSE